MAWQTPKTNWQAPDGVKNTDMNRIEGNLQELYTTGRVTADLTLYVKTTGSDTTGVGTSANPYRTVNKALSVLPRNLSNYTVKIDVASGTYNEDIVVSGFSNGKIIIAGAYNREAVINTLTVKSSVCDIQNLKLSFSNTTGSDGNAINVLDGAVLMCNSTITILGPQADGIECGLYVAGGSTCRLGSTLSVSYASVSAVYVTGASNCYALLVSGSYNTSAILAEEGSIACYSSSNITVTAASFVTRSGGRIYTGGQTSVPNY